MSLPKVPIGIGPPNVLRQPITAPFGALDLTTVSAVTFRVFRPDGVEVTPAWIGSIAAGPASTSMVALYAFAGTEFASATEDGDWRLSAQLTVPGGSVPCESRPLRVVRIP